MLIYRNRYKKLLKINILYREYNDIDEILQYLKSLEEFIIE